MVFQGGEAEVLTRVWCVWERMSSSILLELKLSGGIGEGSKVELEKYADGTS